MDVTIQLVPTAAVSGTISSPIRRPFSVALGTGSCRPAPHTEMLAGAGLRGWYSTAPRWHVSVHRRSPGSYTVKAIVGPVGGGRGTVPNTPTQWAAADVW